MDLRASLLEDSRLCLTIRNPLVATLASVRCTAAALIHAPSILNLQPMDSNTRLTLVRLRATQVHPFTMRLSRLAAMAALALTRLLIKPHRMELLNTLMAVRLMDSRPCTAACQVGLP